MSRFTAYPIPAKTPEELGTGTVANTSYLLGSEGGVLKKIPTGSASIYTNAIQQFKTVALFEADEVLDYESVSVGDVIEAGPHQYTALADDATDETLENSASTPVKVQAVPRSGAITVGQCGADLTGASDSSAAVLKALTLASALGVTLVVDGTPRLDSLVHLNGTTAGFEVVAGPGCGFRVNNGTGGIKITATEVDHTIAMRGVTFWAAMYNAGRPLEIIMPVPSPLSWRSKTVILRDVSCIPLEFNSSSYRWLNGVKLTNAWHGYADHFTFNGGENGAVSTTEALEIDGYSLNFDHFDCYAANVDDGFVVGGESEGPKYYGCTVVTAARGFVLIGDTENPNVVIRDCHTNVTGRGIYCENYNGVLIEDHEAYRLGDAAGYKDIEIQGGKGHRITKSRAALGSSSENWFVYLEDVESAYVGDNFTEGRYHQVQLEGTSKHVFAENNFQQTVVGGESEADYLVNNASGTGNDLRHWRLRGGFIVGVHTNGVTNNLTTGTVTGPLTFNTTPLFNEGGAFASGTPTRITVPVWASVVRITGSVSFPSDSNGSLRRVLIRKNGTASNIYLLSQPPVSGSSTDVTFDTGPLSVSGGDYIELYAQQDSGSTLDVGDTLTKMQVEVLA